uniref:Uncharacterized protein n=1 Tax=Natrinema halophilum TaxID=1699371 RepID=A0A7D5KU29_9EURY
MPTDRRSDSPADDRIPAETVVESIRAAPMPVVNTRYLAEEHDVPTDEMVERLEAMVDAGMLESHEIEGLARLWWLSLESDLAE